MMMEKTFPKSMQVHQNQLDEARLFESSLIYAFKLVALLACGVILESWSAKRAWSAEHQHGEGA
jgi:hypothetical protein